VFDPSIVSGDRKEKNRKEKKRTEKKRKEKNRKEKKRTEKNRLRFCLSHHILVRIYKNLVSSQLS
jgi:hypothetical protein